MLISFYKNKYLFLTKAFMAIIFPLIILISSQIFKMLCPHCYSFLNIFLFQFHFFVGLLKRSFSFCLFFAILKLNYTFYSDSMSISTNILLGHITRSHIKFSCLLSPVQSVTIPWSFLVFHNPDNWGFAQLFWGISLNLRTRLKVFHY